MSKKEKEKFLFKKRMEQIQKIDEQMKAKKQDEMNKFRKHEEEGAAWGMNFDEEDQINQFQRESEMNDNNGQGGDVYDNTSGSEDGDADKDQLLDLEKIKAREGITEKQTSLISKIEGIRRNIQKLIEKKSKLNR